MARRASRYKTILVPTDGSPAARRALPEAIALARRLRARVVGLHVVTPFEAHAYRKRLPRTITLQEFRRHAEQTAAGILEAVRRRAAAQRVPCRCYTAWGTSAADTIADAARRYRCDLIAMASHGRRGLPRLLMGSVTSRVLAHSTVPVLVCR
jgi:nucleotide-binding universal stress UspA family protein